MESASVSQPTPCDPLPVLPKVWVIPNDGYKRHGTKAYVAALNRYGFQPTLPGPYFQTFVEDASRTPGRPTPGSLPALWTGLYKRDKDGYPVHLTADDLEYDLEYLGEISIGSVPQKLRLYFDTGLADLWVKSSSFHLARSSTFKMETERTWDVRYGDHSAVSGIVGTDVVSMPGFEVRKQTVQVALHLPAQFPEDKAGVFGLAFSPLNTVQKDGKPDPQRPLLDNMIQQNLLPKDAQLFTSALYGQGAQGKKSFFTFGMIDQDLVQSSGERITWAPIDSSGGYWMFPSEGAMVNGKMIPLPGNKAVADTGTSLTLVSDEVCDALYKEIEGALYSEETQGFLIPTCIRPDQLPNISLAVGGRLFSIQKEDLLFAPVGTKYWYGGVQSRGLSTFDILGTTFLRSIYTIWDQGNSRFGAVPKIEESQTPFPTPPPSSNGGQGSESPEH